MAHSVGIIGLGMIGEKMLEAFLAHPSFDVAACWDLNTELCDQVQAKYPQAPVVQSGSQVFDQPEIELFYIATPPVTHVDYGLKVIDLGKALLMEKPLSISLTDSKRLVESAKNNQIPTAMNFGYGAGPVVDGLEKAIENNENGPVRSIEIRYEFPSWPLPNQLSAASWITNRNTGGMVREMFSHHVYLIHRLFGPLTVRSVELSYPDEQDAAEDFVVARLQVREIPVWFMGGIGSSRTPRNSDFTVNGESGSLRISEGGQLLYADTSRWREYPLGSTRTAVEARLDQLANLLEGKASRLPTLREGYEVQKVVEELLSK